MPNWAEKAPGLRRAESDNRLKFFVIRQLMKLGMKNPYERKKPELSPELLKEKALEMRSIRSQHDYYVQKLGYLVEELTELWENDIQTSYIEELESMQGALEDYSNLVDEYASLLELAAQELQTNTIEPDKASVLGGTKAGPVTVVLSNIPYLRRGRIDLLAHDPYFAGTQEGVSTELVCSRKNDEYIYSVYPDHIELVKYIGLKRNVEIPAEIDGLPVTHIGLDCFAMAWRVRFVSVHIPDSVTTIYHGAFRGCQHIREVRLPARLKYIGNYAFAFLSELEHVEIPEGVVSLGMGAFRNCVGIKSITIPAGTLRIGNDCFYGCKSLETAVIGDDVVTIDGWAFRSCEHLHSVVIGKRVRTIGECAFYDCIRLMRLDVPESVESIGEHAFYHRRGMELGVVAGSAAEKYALENGHKVAYI